MAKETFYFSHDYGARNDPKLQKVLMKHGQAGIGIYWCLIEMLNEQDGYLLVTDCDSIAFALHSQCDLVESVMRDFGLFVVEEHRFWSESTLKRLDHRISKSKKASYSANIRWNHANALRTHSERNANKVKESKVKESKVNIIVRPTLDEIKNYCIERNNKVDAEAWMAHYESNGWMVGKNKMKDWKAAVRTWEKNNFTIDKKTNPETRERKITTFL